MYRRKFPNSGKVGFFQEICLLSPLRKQTAFFRMKFSAGREPFSCNTGKFGQTAPGEKGRMKKIELEAGWMHRFFPGFFDSGVG
ncbi:MAG: hypothetical protein LKJ59_06810 [Oscillospiraceae bacterium]|nr:hypothetical protein [Oscillospiraceae bacterium]MCI2035320.1 hypothetical protein [Oscillospiraceae bacterium]